jgi:hypothetical protein
MSTVNRQHHFSSTETVAFMFPKAVLREGISCSFNTFHTNTSVKWNSLQLFSFCYEFCNLSKWNSIQIYTPRLAHLKLTRYEVDAQSNTKEQWVLASCTLLGWSHHVAQWRHTFLCSQFHIYYRKLWLLLRYVTIFFALLFKCPPQFH